MTIQHHPSDDNILSYANGSLSRPLGLALGAHMDGCAQCRATAALAQTLGGFFLDSETPAELDTQQYSRIVELLDLPPQASAPPPFCASDIALPLSLRRQRIGARRWLAPGIWVRPILKDKGDGTRAYLLGAAPGRNLPHHGHAGVEMTQLLQGAFFDGARRYGPGDFLEADREQEHSLRVGPGEECVCIIASQGVPRGLPGLLMRVLT